MEVKLRCKISHFDLRQARLWACGRGDMSTPSFGSNLNPISTKGADYAHPIFWCPHQVLKAIGAPVRFCTGMTGFLTLLTA